MTIPANAIQLKDFAIAEAARTGLTVGTVKWRVSQGFYRGMKLLRRNARVVFVLKPGVVRDLVSHKGAAARRGRRVNLDAFHAVENQEPSRGKYEHWMSRFDCGGRVVALNDESDGRNGNDGGVIN